MTDYFAFAADNARRQFAPTDFAIGETVDVLAAICLPRERIIGQGKIERITYQSSDGTPLYWIEGMKCARTARVLRLAPDPAYVAYLKGEQPDPRD